MKYTKQRGVYKAGLISEPSVRKFGESVRDRDGAETAMVSGFSHRQDFFLPAKAAHSCFLLIHGHVPTCSEVLGLFGLDG